MLERLKRALVESFVGAIALGWVFSQAIVQFANIPAAPIARWLSRREYRALTSNSAGPTGFSLQDALPELVRFFALLLLGYVLLRWLYYKPLEEEETEPPTSPSSSVELQ